ncbi:MAG: 50S ribosomal protein L29 [Anaerolineae bacterium]|nr:50S ribosomal protein L29 [Anaerolineae bacterium]
MKSREIWEMTPDEIRNKLDDAHAELFNLRFQFSIGQMQNNARLGQVRRDIARFSTILRAKQLQSQSVPGKAGTEVAADMQGRRSPSGDSRVRAGRRQSGQDLQEQMADPAAQAIPDRKRSGRGGRSK